eukprot:7472738-Karenia_brevis.AAC.1
MVKKQLLALCVVGSAMNSMELEWIPPEHWNIAMCFYNTDERSQAMWAEGNEDAIAAEMRIEGRSKSYRRTAIRYVKTQRSLVADYVNGKIDADTSS